MLVQPLFSVRDLRELLLIQQRARLLLLLLLLLQLRVRVSHHSSGLHRLSAGRQCVLLSLSRSAVDRVQTDSERMFRPYLVTDRCIPLRRG